MKCVKTKSEIEGEGCTEGRSILPERTQKGSTTQPGGMEAKIGCTVVLRVFEWRANY